MQSVGARMDGQDALDEVAELAHVAAEEFLS